MAAIVLPVSCSTPAKVDYLLDLEYNTVYEAKPAPELRLKVDDEISIQVYSSDPDLSAPFNTGVGVTAGGGLDAASLSSRYVVDSRGNIDFPVLGEIPVVGKTLSEVRRDIADRITRRGFIQDPVVKVELDNFTITVLGNIGQSVMKVEGNSINILQVIANAGGVDGNVSKIRDVMVVRTVDGKRQAYPLNLQTKDLFDSPVFYLQQNDVVYVKSRGAKLSNGGNTFLQVFSPIVNTLSTIAYILLWITR